MKVGAGLDCPGPLEAAPGMELACVLDRYPGRIAVMSGDIPLMPRDLAADACLAPAKPYLVECRVGRGRPTYTV